MNTQDFDALMASLGGPPAAAPAPAAPATASTAKKSSTSRGRGSEDIKLTGEVVPVKPVTMAQQLEALPGLAKLRDDDFRMRSFDTGVAEEMQRMTLAAAEAERARDSGDYSMVSRQAPFVDEMVLKYGAPTPSFSSNWRDSLSDKVKKSYGKKGERAIEADPNRDIRKTAPPGIQADRAQLLGEFAAKREARDQNIAKGAIARTKAIELVTGGDKSRMAEIQPLVALARDGQVTSAAAENALAPEYKGNPEALQALMEQVKKIVESEPKKEEAPGLFDLLTDFTW